MDRPGTILANELRRAKSPRDYSTAYRRIYKTADTDAAEYVERTGIRLACGSCSFCCYQWVRVLAHEVFAIVDYIEETMPPAERLAIISQLKSYHAQTAHLTGKEKDRSTTPRACPLLMNGKCSVYPVRPSNCRHFHSLDSRFCESNIENPDGWPNTPMDDGLKIAWDEMIRSADYAYFISGHDQTTYDLAEACLAAMTNPSCRKRWSDGKKALLKLSPSR